MRKLALLVTLFCLATLALAQSSPQVVSEVNHARPKPGMTAQWEAGRKQHSAFHAAQKDAWSIFVWEIVTGEHCSILLVGTGRFELPTPRTPSECSTRLSHVPTRKDSADSLSRFSARIEPSGGVHT
jgi:hypothetical protein